MRALMMVLASLLIGAASTDVPVGKFQTWSAYRNAPLDFSSGGVTVHVAAAPCPAKPIGDSTCAVDGYNNQATVTVSAPAMQSLTVKTDRQSEYARIAVVRFDLHDPRAGVIIESQYGGSGGDMTAQWLIPSGNGFRALSVADGGYLQGESPDFPKDLSGDGIIDVKLADGRFDSVFGCNACTPRPPRLFAVKNGKIVDESRDPALRPIFAADMARLAPICLSKARDRNGACAAYAADAARAGRFAVAWSAMKKHYDHEDTLWQPCSVSDRANDRCPDGNVTHLRTFPESLNAFLRKTGYLPS